MIKKTFTILTILVFAVLLYAQNSDFQPGKAKITATALNIRNIASTGGTVVATLKRGEVFDVIERSAKQVEVDKVTDYWYKVKLADGKTTGWVFGQFITFDINSESGLRWKSVVPAQEQKFTSIAASGTGEIMATTEEGNIFISGDGGKTWRKSTPQALGINVGKINKIIYVNKTIWIAASGASKGGVWKSANNGSSWAQFTTSQGLPSNEAYDIFVSDKNEIYVATDKGVSVSKNGGSIWALYPTKENNSLLADANCVAVAKDGTVFVGTLHGLFISTAAKPGWTRKGEKNPNMGDKILSIAVTPEGDVYVGTDKGLNKGSISAVDQWNGIGGNTKVNNIIVDSSARVIVATDNGLNISLDNGASWVTYNKDSGLASDRVSRITVNPNNNVIWATSDTAGLSYHE